MIAPVMAEAGLMRGRLHAIHTHHRSEFISLYPDSIPVINEKPIHDGTFITRPGGTAAIDLAVDILSGHCGNSRGMKGLTALVVDKQRGAHHIEHLPFQDLKDCGEWRVERAVWIMRQNLGTQMRIDKLAN